MQPLITIILTASLMVHATFGCCLHHTHACETGCCVAPTPDASNCACDSDDEPSASSASLGRSSDGEKNHSGHGPHRCEGDTCSFSLTGSSRNVDTSKARSFLPVLGCPATPLIVIAPIADCLNRATSYKADLASPAMRLHLVLAVLLI